MCSVGVSHLKMQEVNKRALFRYPWTQHLVCIIHFTLIHSFYSLCRHLYPGFDRKQYTDVLLCKRSLHPQCLFRPKQTVTSIWEEHLPTMVIWLQPKCCISKIRRLTAEQKISSVQVFGCWLVRWQQRILAVGGRVETNKLLMLARCEQEQIQQIVEKIPHNHLRNRLCVRFFHVGQSEHLTAWDCNAMAEMTETLHYCRQHGLWLHIINREGNHSILRW